MTLGVFGLGPFVEHTRMKLESEPPEPVKTKNNYVKSLLPLMASVCAVKNM